MIDFLHYQYFACDICLAEIFSHKDRNLLDFVNGWNLQMLGVFYKNFGIGSTRTCRCNPTFWQLPAIRNQSYQFYQYFTDWPSTRLESMYGLHLNTQSVWNEWHVLQPLFNKWFDSEKNTCSKYQTCRRSFGPFVCLLCSWTVKLPNAMLDWCQSLVWNTKSTKLMAN